MADEITDIWVYLATSPLLSLTLTLVAYQIVLEVWTRIGRPALLNPVLASVLIIVAVLAATGTPYDTYFEGAQFIHFLLGPATVALAIPLYRQFERIRANKLAIAASLVTGSVTGIATGLGLGALLGLDRVSFVSLAPKSVTAPVAMGIVERIGGLPSLTAVLVIVTGIIGAALGPAALNAIGVTDAAARGMAMGVGSHGIGTARALQESEAAGAFSGLAMGLNALATAILVPLAFALFS
ncbi:LrgB family protein [Fulvimarina sp. 2208YS6-2-32]|uniref:LrgB family protein n=1 Tax=Fulvimarina uroteuthidis TaxID=3098149 RepID=A0ABU5I2R5_9HYPH|nr:LrgB family protein [Fulvimarina sp. 2208YS6-2-32]MDY8109667.1 LrgB family protein [Fulvimarina sp. 2208YS6-2-32]